MSVKVKRVLVSHPDPKDDSSPYAKLTREFGLEFVFRNFVDIQGLSTSEFRKQNVNPLDSSGVIFTGKQPIDHFFRLCKDLRVEMPPDTKYFCVGETTAMYLQKYIIIRKRKLFVAKKSITDLMELLGKHHDDKYIYPCGDSPRPDILQFLQTNAYQHKVARVFDTVSQTLNDLSLDKFQMICFFAPNTVQSILDSFPNFAQDHTPLVAVFGKNTAEVAEQASIRIDIMAPTPEAPSLTMAIENYLRAQKKAN
jgi:uroporphyrinogen-III synthase